jgi:di/tricarboxylate transporter
MVLQSLLGLLGLGGDHGDTDGHDFADHDGGHDLGGHDSGPDGHGQQGSASTFIFQLLSLRTVAAALTFFGLSGLAASHFFPGDQFTPLGLALLAGMSALVVVAMILRSFRKLEADGTVRIRRAIGQVGTIYLRVPGQKAGTGKITLQIQNRTVELQAQTAGETLPTQARAVVVAIVSPDTVEVAPVPATTEAPAHA